GWLDGRAAGRTSRGLHPGPVGARAAAGASLLMAAPNSVRGTTMPEPPPLDEPLKGEWGFDGVVVSDWFAARNTVAAGNGGLDLAMPADRSPWREKLVAAVRAGEVDERAVGEKVRRLLRSEERRVGKECRR